jgi:hypothetical protein
VTALPTAACWVFPALVEFPDVEVEQTLSVLRQFVDACRFSDARYPFLTPINSLQRREHNQRRGDLIALFILYPRLGQERNIRLVLDRLALDEDSFSVMMMRVRSRETPACA